MREINISNDVIDFLKKSIEKDLTTNAIIKKMALKGWAYTCSDWDGFIALLDERNLDKIFTEYEFFIRY